MLQTLLLDNTTIQDHYKNVIHKKPYSVEVCYDQQTSGDKTGDAIKGAIIGGLLGNNIKGEQDGGAIGAVIGGMLGHANSNATVEHELFVLKLVTTKNVRYLPHYYSFVYEGKQYDLNFKSRYNVIFNRHYHCSQSN